MPPTDHAGLTCSEAQLLLDHLRVERVELRQALESVEAQLIDGDLDAHRIVSLVRRVLA